jgi:hypothetical protein
MRKEIPAGLTMIKPIPKAITAVMIPDDEKLSQKGKPNRVVKIAEV